MGFRLRHQQHNLELNPGDFFIGRSAECQLALDDPLVSRKHAVLKVGADSVVIKDLGSRNGVVVNGTKIDTSRILLDGDRILIGSQELILIVARPRIAGEAGTRARRSVTQTLNSASPPSRGVTQPLGEPLPESTSRRIEAFPVLSSLADKALALGHTEDAERILTPLMMDVLSTSQDARQRPADDTIDRAARYAVRFAAATGQGSWVDYVVKLYAAVRRPCPGPLVEDLHSVLRKTSGIDLQALRAYLEILRESLETFGPAQRFLVQRIEGLERLASLK
jgi:pSer/pThr/pTyr-binding forkhead associated (FHA) protein